MMTSAAAVVLRLSHSASRAIGSSRLSSSCAGLVSVKTATIGRVRNTRVAASARMSSAVKARDPVISLRRRLEARRAQGLLPGSAQQAVDETPSLLMVARALHDRDAV